MLRAEDIRVPVGTASVPNLYEPDDLRRLAGLLARSPHPGPREVGEHLARLADDPGTDNWPLPRQS